MKKLFRTISFMALLAMTASGVLAQQRQTSPGLASRVQPEWRTSIPRTKIHGEYGGELYAVRMLNHNIGWALGGHSSTHTLLFRTRDGGKSWERQTLFDGEGTRLRDIGFADANNGWIVGDQHILRTTDGGETWVPVETEKAIGRGYSVEAHELLVLGPDAIVVGTNAQNRQIMRTLDGGGTWELIGLVKDGGGGAGSENSVTGLALGEGSTVFATTGSHPYSAGVIYRSTDGGHSWERMAEAEKPLHGIAFRGKRGVAVGEGLAFFTEDGGDTWRRTAMPGRRYAVDFTSANTVLAVGRDPSVVISANGGRTWQAASGPSKEAGALVAIAAVDPGWVFMASGHDLHHFVDPNHTEPLATGRLPIPVDLQIPGGR
ncbi:MAG: YCF48-related protein, partial [Gemmatimonadaceae bacterium]